MRFQGPALAALLICLSCFAVPASARGLDPDTLSGLVLSLGQAHSQHSDSGEGTALFLDANYSRVFINGGVSYKSFSDKVANAYVGIGLAGVIQLQMGLGTEGPVQRIRSDLNFAKAYDFFTGIRRNRYDQSLGTRLTFTFASETYHKDRRFDNFHAGIGLLY